MLDAQDLNHLTRWCRVRHVTWQPARTDGGDPAILISSATAWGEHLVIENEDGFRLLGARSEPLAEASDLALLLDALDAGLDAPVRYTARPSPSFWNSPGSAIT